MHSLLSVGGEEFEAAGGQSWYDPYVDYLKDNEILDADLDYGGAATREQFISLLYAALPEDVELAKLNRTPRFASSEITRGEAIAVITRLVLKEYRVTLD